jgi:RES domain-containing protein
MHLRPSSPFSVVDTSSSPASVPSVIWQPSHKSYRSRFASLSALACSVPQDLGTAWLEKNESLLLRVPSAIVPETLNCLFNPSHRQAAEFRIVEALAYPFDARLKR